MSLDLEQQLSSDLGMFARAGKAAGNVETYEFSDIDRTISAGLSLRGKRWARADDTVGLAGIVNGISAAREQYLNAGGLGILVGDGALPIAAIFRQLKKQGYQGVCSLEYEIDADDPMPGMQKSFSYMRGVLAGLRA